MRFEFTCAKCNQKYEIDAEDLSEAVAKAKEEGVLDENTTTEKVGAIGLRNSHYQSFHAPKPKKKDKKEIPVTRL